MWSDGAAGGFWGMVKHGEIVLKHLCVSGAVACDASSLVAAARAGSVSLVRYIVEECGVSPAADSNGALCVAAQEGHTDIVQFLLDLPLERGVRPDAQGIQIQIYDFKMTTRSGRLDGR